MLPLFAGGFVGEPLLFAFRAFPIVASSRLVLDATLRAALLATFFACCHVPTPADALLHHGTFDVGKATKVVELVVSQS
ncbi:MAG TPA: hypothetical protein VNH11_34350 [Pirellulales bacterium]|nr:hypothetical protein [Pirellulales bacterium]